jgi:hypothetical protein
VDLKGFNDLANSDIFRQFLNGVYGVVFCHRFLGFTFYPTADMGSFHAKLFSI